MASAPGGVGPKPIQYPAADGPPTSTTIAHANETSAPSDTSVSMLSEPDRRFRSVARWNGHAAQVTIGTASSTQTQLPAGEAPGRARAPAGS